MRPATLEQMRDQLAKQHGALSRRLKEVGEYVDGNPQSMALDTAAEIAKKAGVHPSTLVRFANHFGFSGFTELQKLFKDDIQRNYSDYGQRIQRQQRSRGEGAVSPSQLLDEFTRANRLSLNKLSDGIDPQQLDLAVGLLDRSPSIHVCGVGRAFPVSMYFAYALGHMQVQCHAINGLGMMQDAQANCIARNDVLIAITFSPYSEITQSIINTAFDRGAKVMLIAGEESCPSAAKAEVILTVKDAEVRSFRSLTSTMCLAQTLCIALGYRRQAGAWEDTARQANSAA